MAPLALERVRDGSTEKRFLHGQHRSCAPAETLERVRPHLDCYGITRIANVTGLDRLGIPVVIVVRPNSRSVSTSQGKGIDLDAARASGVMEAVEQHHAERRALEVWWAAHRTVRAAGRALDPARVLRSQPHGSPEDELAWVRGFDIVATEPVWVPFERVHVDYTCCHGPGTGIVVQDSNGLASGNTLAEALLQGLLELVERDASALEARRRTGGAQPRWIDPAQICDPIITDVLDRCDQAGVALRIADASSDLGIAVFEAGIVEPAGGLPASVSRVQTMWGGGCHLDPAVAMLRSITEAAQARLTLIVGAREDLFADDYPDRFATAATQPFEDVSASPGAGDAPECLAQPTIEGDIEVVLDRLGARDIDEVIAVDLTPDRAPFSVVRVIVPELEGYAWSPYYRPGPRALAAAQ